MQTVLNPAPILLSRSEIRCPQVDPTNPMPLRLCPLLRFLGQTHPAGIPIFYPEKEKFGLTPASPSAGISGSAGEAELKLQRSQREVESLSILHSSAVNRCSCCLLLQMHRVHDVVYLFLQRRVSVQVGREGDL